MFLNTVVKTQGGLSQTAHQGVIQSMPGEMGDEIDKDQKLDDVHHLVYLKVLMLLLEPPVLSGKPPKV